jgi:Leucine-rich repeat (LRR) protein
MTKLQLIQAEIETLTNDEFIYLKNWINELDAQQWDKQIEEDSNLGKLDFLIEEALLEIGSHEEYERLLK